MRKCETESHVCFLCFLLLCLGLILYRSKNCSQEITNRVGKHTYIHIRVFNYYDDGGHFMEDPKKRERERK